MEMSRRVVLLAALLLLWGGVEGDDFDVDPPMCNFVLEMMHLQDMSESFDDDLPELVIQLPKFLAMLNVTYPESCYGVASFVDKPLPPFGFAYEGPWFEGDWCLDVTTPIGNAHSSDVLADLLERGLGGGHDWPENQLGAIHDVAKNASLAGWTNRTHDERGYPIVRVITLSTDAVYHLAPDGQISSHNLRPNDGDGWTVCDEEDYPSIAQVRDALRSRQIYTIFLGGNHTDEDVTGVYQELLDVMGVRGAAYPINEDSSNILEAMAHAFATYNNLTCAIPTVDIVFTHDVTWSYRNDITHLRPKIDELTEEMSVEYITPRFGLATFGDKPLSPLGHARSGDYCYRLHHPLTYDRTEVIDAAEDVSMTSGLDWRESQLDAIISTVRDPAMGWRTGDEWNGFDLHRIVVIATDSGYHRAPHAANAGWSLAPHSGGMVNCTGEEYPTWQQAAQALVDEDVHPLFVPTSDVASIYRRLLRDMEADFGIIGEVVELADFGEFANVVFSGVRRLEAKLRNARQIGGSAMLGSLADAGSSQSQGDDDDYLSGLEGQKVNEMQPQVADPRALADDATAATGTTDESEGREGTTTTREATSSNGGSRTARTAATLPVALTAALAIAKQV